MPSVTTFGFGKSLDTDLMVNLANWTGGRFVYRVIFLIFRVLVKNSLFRPLFRSKKVVFGYSFGQNRSF